MVGVEFIIQQISDTRRLITPERLLASSEPIMAVEYDTDGGGGSSGEGEET